jgi:hypothetical protein
MLMAVQGTHTPLPGGPRRTTWSTDARRKIAEADDLHIAPFRADGVTHGTPTWMWSVAVDDALDVRAYNGKGSHCDQRDADANMTLQKEHNHAQYIAY